MKNLKKISLLLGGALLCSSLLFSCGPAKTGGNKVSQSEWANAFNELINVKKNGISESNADVQTTSNIMTRDGETDTSNNKLSVDFEKGILLEAGAFKEGEFPTSILVAKGLEIQYVTKEDAEDEAFKSQNLEAGVYPTVWALYTPKDSDKTYEYFRWHYKDASQNTSAPAAFDDTAEDALKAYDTGNKWKLYSAEEKDKIDTYEQTCALFEKLKNMSDIDAKWDSSKGAYKFEFVGDLVFEIPNDNKEPTFNLHVQFDGSKVSNLTITLASYPDEQKEELEKLKDSDKLEEREMYETYLAMLDMEVEIVVNYIDGGSIKDIIGYTLPEEIAQQD